MRERYHRKYGYAYEVVSDNNRELMSRFHEICRKNNIASDMNKIFAWLYEFPKDKGYEQMSLF